MTSAVVQKFDVFAQLVAHGSIAGCARELCLPAATVIAAMDRLEDHMGFALFAVTDGGVTLTGDGRKVARALSGLSLRELERWAEAVARSDAEGSTLISIPGISADPDDDGIAEPEPEPQESAVAAEPLALEEVDADRESAPSPAPRSFQPQTLRRGLPEQTPQETSAEEGRTIILASHPAIFSHFQEALVAFEEASPDIGISLRLTGLDEAEVEALFRDGLADIAYFYALEEPSGLPSRYAWSERISLFVGKDHPLAATDIVMAGDLATLSYAALARDNVNRRLSERALAEGGLDVGDAAFESDNLYEVLKYVEGHNAYFAAFGPMARDFGKMSGVRRLAYAQALPQVQVRQAVRGAMAEDPSVLALAEFLFR